MSAGFAGPKKKDVDFSFFEASVSESESVANHGGFSTRVARESGQILKPKISVQFLRFLDGTPSDPS